MARTDLTPKEIAAYEKLLAGLPQPNGDPSDDYLVFINELRRRPDLEKRMHVRMGVLHPEDRVRSFWLAALTPPTFATWAEFDALHPNGEGAPLVFRILND